MISTTTETDLSQLYKAALGEKNQTYYLKKFAHFNEKDAGFHPSWNWGACFGIAIWALYRKMYGWFFVFLAAQVITGIAIKIHTAFGLVEVVLWIGFSIFANSLYHRKITENIINAQKSNESELAAIQYLSKRGGVHALLLYVIGIAIILAIAVVGFTYKNTLTADAQITKVAEQATKEIAQNIAPPATSSNSIDKYILALRINPEDAVAWYNLGIAYNDIKQYSQAINAYQQALRINPEYANAWNNLGHSYANTKQYPQAINAHQQALRINPEDSDAWYGLGNTYNITKQYTQAINATQQALRINPEHAIAWYSLGVTYYLTGDRAKVMEIYKKLRSLDTASADQFFNTLILPGG